MTGLRILRKRLLKVFPVWLLLILVVGTTFAVFTWISNRITTTVTVTARPITLTGTFNQIAWKDEEVSNSFEYTVNVETPTGYIYIRFASGYLSTVNDIEFVELFVTPDGQPETAGAFVLGYPMYSTNEILWLFQNSTSGGAFELGATGGYIDFIMTYHVAGSITAEIQVTSTLP